MSDLQMQVAMRLQKLGALSMKEDHLASQLEALREDKRSLQSELRGLGSVSPVEPPQENAQEDEDEVHGS